MHKLAFYAYHFFKEEYAKFIIFRKNARNLISEFTKENFQDFEY